MVNRPQAFEPGTPYNAQVETAGGVSAAVITPLAGPSVANPYDAESRRDMADRLGDVFEQLKARGYAAGGVIDAVRTQFVPTFGQDMAFAFAPGFAAGGVPERPTARLAPVTFVLDGQAFQGFQGTTDAVSQLGKFAAQRRLAGAGRKPGWHGA